MLIKDAEALERMARVDTVIVDKTGTLTEGKPKLTDVVSLGDLGEDAVLAMAAALERGSEHPLAEAIVSGAKERGVERRESSDFEAMTGKGVKGLVEGKDVALGNAAMLDALSIDTDEASKKASALQEEGKTAMFVAIDGQLAGIVAVADTDQGKHRTGDQGSA